MKPLRILSLLLIAMLMLALVACGGGGTVEETAEEAAGEVEEAAGEVEEAFKKYWVDTPGRWFAAAGKESGKKLVFDDK